MAEAGTARPVRLAGDTAMAATVGMRQAGPADRAMV